MSLENSADNLRLIRFYAWSSALSAALSSQYILSEIFGREFETCRNSVQHHTDQLAMRLTENRYPIFSSECIHMQ